MREILRSFNKNGNNLRRIDLFLKKQMIEILAEQLRQETPVNPKKKK